MANKKSVILFDPRAGTDSFKRPDHPDFMTTNELKKRGFSGLRSNSMSHDLEIWIDGEVRKTITYGELAVNPMAMSQAYEEIFGVPSPVATPSLLKPATKPPNTGWTGNTGPKSFA